MAATGPVEFLAGSQQVSLPLTTLYFENGQLKASGPLYAANQAQADKWLRYLSDQGLIISTSAPPPKQALLISAKNAGSTGNDISIVISNIRQDPGDNTKRIFDATLTQTDVYPSLKKDTVKVIVGESPSFTDGSRPGLIYVSSAGAPDLPSAGTYAPGGTFVVTLPKDGGGTAFKVTYRVKDAAASGTVQISNVSGDSGTFSLVATWSKTVTGIHVTAFGTSFSDHITVTDPDGAAATDGDVPAAGTLILAGGSDAATAQKASAAAPAAE
jgi:hypothetical protein